MFEAAQPVGCEGRVVGLVEGIGRRYRDGDLRMRICA